jgi:hypothetical protein
MAKPKQIKVPGTEPLTSAEMAKRQAAAPLRPIVAQKPCDVGLFSDNAAQVDLIDMLRRSPRG